MPKPAVGRFQVLSGPAPTSVYGELENDHGRAVTMLVEAGSWNFPPFMDTPPAGSPILASVLTCSVPPQISTLLPELGFMKELTPAVPTEPLPTALVRV